MGFRNIFCLFVLFSASALGDANTDSRQPSSPPMVQSATTLNCCEHNYSADECALDPHSATGGFSCFCKETNAISGNPEVKSYHCAGDSRSPSRAK